jgi:two-component system, OmpR family, alkaline phosphatase synthesis response regulator PhoP
MSKRILIVDDESCFRDIMKLSLESEGYKASLAVNGEEAMRELKKERPHLMLLDLNMPIMDGHRVCELVRANDDLKDIPIILVTAMDADVAAIKVKNNLANDYVIKPFEFEELFGKMVRLIGPLV